MSSPMDPIAKQLAWELGTRKSVEVHVTTEIINHEEGPQASSIYTEHYIETATGQRFCEFQALTQGKVVSRSAHYSDGSRFADVNYSKKDPSEQQTIYINRQYWMEGGSDRKQLPGPLLFLYVGREPLYEALPKGQYMGKGEVMGRECSVILFPQVHWATPQDQAFYLDQATSIPLKVESFPNQAARDRNEPKSVWSAQSLDKVQEHYVTLKSQNIEFGKDRNPVFSWRFNVESIEFDKEYPASTFWPTFEPGAVVFDATTEKVYTVPGAKPASTEAGDQAGTTAEPIRAEPPRDWSTVASNSALGLGLAIVIVAGFLWWRRH